MAVKNSDTVSSDELVEKLFVAKMSDNDLAVYFNAMHYKKNDFHIHNNLLSEYVYNNYDKVNHDPLQEEKVFWEDNVNHLHKYLEKLISAAETLEAKGEVKKENKKLVTKLITNKELIKELAPKMEEHINLALLQYRTFLKKLMICNRKPINYLVNWKKRNNL